MKPEVFLIGSMRSQDVFDVGVLLCCLTSHLCEMTEYSSVSVKYWKVLVLVFDILVLFVCA